MADTKISDLTTLTGVNVDTAADVIPIVDTNVTTTKKILVEQLRIAVRPVLGTVATTTSGTEHDFTGIPAGTRKITMGLAGVSTDGTTPLLVQIGDSGGFETTGYNSSGCSASDGASWNVTVDTTGFRLQDSSVAASTLHGELTLTLVDSSTNTWVAKYNGARSTAVFDLGAGSKALSGELTQIRLTTVGGAGTFDAGSVNILYE
jgi:hypothetical protein